ILRREYGGAGSLQTLRVWYITMMIPAPSETFAANDIRALRRLGLDVSAHALRPAHKMSEELVEQQGLKGVNITHGNLADVLVGLWLMLRHPRVAGQALTWLVKHSLRKPSHLIRSLVLLPRTIQLFHMIRRARPDVVHLFWGHYPSMLGH